VEVRVWDVCFVEVFFAMIEGRSLLQLNLQSNAKGVDLQEGGIFILIGTLTPVKSQRRHGTNSGQFFGAVNHLVRMRSRLASVQKCAARGSLSKEFTHWGLRQITE